MSTETNCCLSKAVLLEELQGAQRLLSEKSRLAIKAKKAARAQPRRGA